MIKNKKTGLSENWSIDKSSIEKGQYKILPELNPGVGKYPEENGPVKYDEKGYPDKATPKQIGAMAERLEEMRQMTGSDGRYDKPKPKKKVIEPIEIPNIISVPRHHVYPRDMSHTTFGRYDQPIKNPESYTKGPETPVGLSQRFTQDKLREGKILKQLDREMANNERKKNETNNIRGDHD